MNANGLMDMYAFPGVVLYGTSVDVKEITFSQFNK